MGGWEGGDTISYLKEEEKGERAPALPPRV